MRKLVKRENKSIKKDKTKGIKFNHSITKGVELRKRKTKVL